MLIGKLGTGTIKRTEIATAHLPEVLSDVFGTRRKSISLFFLFFFLQSQRNEQPCYATCLQIAEKEPYQAHNVN